MAEHHVGAVGADHVEQVGQVALEAGDRRRRLAGAAVEGGQGVGAGVDHGDPVAELGRAGPRTRRCRRRCRGRRARSGPVAQHAARSACDHTTAVRALPRRSLAEEARMASQPRARTLGVIRAPGAAVPRACGRRPWVLAGRLDVGVGRHLEAAGVHQHPAPAHAAGGCGPRCGRRLAGLLDDGGGHTGRVAATRPRPATGQLRHGPPRARRRDRACSQQARGSSGSAQAAGGAQGDAPVAGAAQLAADHQQPGVEDGGGVGALGVLEERRVDRAGARRRGSGRRPGARTGSAGSGWRP